MNSRALHFCTSVLMSLGKPQIQSHEAQVSCSIAVKIKPELQVALHGTFDHAAGSSMKRRNLITEAMRPEGVCPEALNPKPY